LNVCSKNHSRSLDYAARPKPDVPLRSRRQFYGKASPPTQILSEACSGSGQPCHPERSMICSEANIMRSRGTLCLIVCSETTQGLSTTRHVPKPDAPLRSRWHFYGKGSPQTRSRETCFEFPNRMGVGPAHSAILIRLPVYPLRGGVV
jgi:hypothetical protein